MAKKSAPAKFVAEVRSHAQKAQDVQARWTGVAALSDAKLAKIVEGALTLKTAIKKTARHLYREADPYGRIAAIKARNEAAQVAA